MNKEVRQAVIERSKGGCEYCYKYIGDNGHLHHSISGNGKRNTHEKIETCFYICEGCHEELHHNRYLEMIFKLKAQINLMSNYLSVMDIEQVRRDLGGRLYG